MIHSQLSHNVVLVDGWIIPNWVIMSFQWVVHWWVQDQWCKQHQVLLPLQVAPKGCFFGMASYYGSLVSTNWDYNLISQEPKLSRAYDIHSFVEVPFWSKIFVSNMFLSLLLRRGVLSILFRFQIELGLSYYIACCVSWPWVMEHPCWW